MEHVTPILLPAGLLIGITFGWLLGRASVKDVLAGSRALRAMLRDTLMENRNLTFKVRELSVHRNATRRRSAPASSPGLPPFRGVDDTDSPAIEAPTGRPSVVLNGAHRAEVMRRRAELADESDGVTYPSDPVNEDVN